MKKIIHGCLLIASALSIGTWFWLAFWSTMAELSTRLFIGSSVAMVVSQLYLMFFFIANLPEIK